MKKNLIAMALSTAAAFALPQAQAFDGTVNFMGEILDTACTVDIGASNTMTVDMGRIARTTFVNTGDAASKNKFTLVLKDCPSNVTSARVNFDGMGDTARNDLLALTSVPSSATGVAIRLFTADQNPLPINQTSGYSYPLWSAEAYNNLDFYAAYVATSVPVQAGVANAVANFTIVYN